MNFKKACFDLVKIAICILLLDSIYLGLTRNFYLKKLLSIQKEPIKLNYLGILITYLIIICSFYVFVILENRTPIYAFGLGIAMYGTYDFTTMSVFKNWNLLTACCDTLWGGLLFYLTLTGYHVFSFD
jgi:uncharacterized membrane protein